MTKKKQFNEQKPGYAVTVYLRWRDEYKETTTHPYNAIHDVDTDEDNNLSLWSDGLRVGYYPEGQWLGYRIFGVTREEVTA